VSVSDPGKEGYSELLQENHTKGSKERKKDTQPNWQAVGRGESLTKEGESLSKKKLRKRRTEGGTLRRRRKREGGGGEQSAYSSVSVSAGCRRRKDSNSQKGKNVNRNFQKRSWGKDGGGDFRGERRGNQQAKRQLMSQSQLLSVLKGRLAGILPKRIDRNVKRRGASTIIHLGVRSKSVE